MDNNKNQKDSFEEQLREKFFSEAEEIEKEVCANTNTNADSESSDQLPEDLFARMKQNLDKQIEDYEKQKAAQSTSSNEEDAYLHLTEEDKEALRIGREVLEERRSAEKHKMPKNKILRSRRRLQRMVAAVAVIVLTLTVSVTSMGGPERVIRIMKEVVGKREISRVDSSEENKIVENDDEKGAYDELAENFGIEPVCLTLYPEEMKFKKMVYDENLQTGELLYTYNKENIVYIVSAIGGVSSWGYDTEDEFLKAYEIKKDGVNIVVKEYNTPKKHTKRYAAEFEYNTLTYYLYGAMEQEKFEDIINNLHFY